MNRNGFTLIELMVTIVIVSTLSAIAALGYASIRKRAEMTTEINGAKQLMTAFHQYAADHNDRVLPGYQSDPEAVNLDGKPLHHPQDARYPWRLAPYAPKMNGIFVYNGNERMLDEDNRDYLVSVHPNLGMNAVFVGGHYGSGSPLRPSPRLVEAVGKYYVSRLSEVHNGSSLVVFASARHDSGKVGNFEVRAPNILAPEWKSGAIDPDGPASDTGFVDFRWKGKAVAAMVAGNVELLSPDELRDMRRWSNQAARLNDPDFTVGRN
ncbi:cleavage protein [Haloferula helveola]|uniref:Cleavage protein n=1 Tax=Haloferula helveola TaxID=490095 RepID=A0ABN6H0N4_9BACT|nr:cleavage protein [Haloferula helveola]